MGIATVHANLRSAFREKLLTLVDIDHAPGVSVTLASGVFTRASGSWLTAGFCPGMEVTVQGFTGSPLYGVVETVSASALKLNVSGAQTLAGGGRFIVGLPQGRAWEGFDFFPVDGRPYLSESVRASVTTLETICNPSGVGVATNILEASATFFYPKNKGTLALERMVGALLLLLAESPRRLAHGGDAAVVQRVERTPIYEDGSRIACAVTARLMAITTS